MAKITNLSTGTVLIKTSNNVNYDLKAGQTLTLLDADVKYEFLDSAIEKQIIEVLTNDGQPYFDQYGRSPGDQTTTNGLTNAELRASPVPVVISGGSVPGGDGLTDTQLRASPVPISISGVTAGTKTSAQSLPVTLASDEPIASAVGAKADSAATDNTGSWSLIALVKRLATLIAGVLTVTPATRNVVGRQTIDVSTSTYSTLTVPNGAVAANIQADGGSLRITLDGSTTPTSTTGSRIDDGVFYYVDTTLANVRMYAPSASKAQVTYFDKV